MPAFRATHKAFTHIFVLMQPLPTKLILRKKRAKEGRSSDEVEHFPAPAKVTLRQRPHVAAIELKDEGVLLYFCSWKLWACLVTVFRNCFLFSKRRRTRKTMITRLVPFSFF